MLFQLIDILHHLHAVVLADAMRQMNDEVAFVQLDEAVDRPTFELRLLLRDAADVRPVEQFVIAEHDDALRYQPKPAPDTTDAQRDSLGQFRHTFVEQLGKTVLLALVVTGDQNAFLPTDDFRQLTENFGSRAGEAFDRFNLQMTRLVETVGGDGSHLDRRLLRQLRHDRVDAEQPARILHPLQVLPTFRHQIAQLAEH